MGERQILPPNLRLGPYEILTPIGAGGAGEVYHALDTRLGRSVAIKVLTKAAPGASEPDSLLEREARVISQLKHPHICVLHDIGQHEGLYYLVMEYLEGTTLAASLRDGPLPLSQTLEYAIQIASALDRAHGQGVIHRDLKPGNIMITRDGSKLLDFGLAKILAGFREDDADATMTVTTDGAISGTVPYMSPEQALQDTLDARSDLFSFGIVLYQMLTGKMPFAGRSPIACFDAILHHVPDAPSSLNAAVPAELDAIVARSLEKTREARYQSAAEIHTDLVHVKRMIEGGEKSGGSLHSSTSLRSAPATVPSRRFRSWMILAPGVIALALGIAWKVWWSGPQDDALDPASASFSQLTSQPGQELFASLSPDGKSVVYAGQASGNWDIYLQRVGGKNSINLTRESSAEDTQPAFSPDGELIAFRSERNGGGIFVMGATGESVKRVSEMGYFPAWSPKGDKIVCSTFPFEEPEVRIWKADLAVIDVATGNKQLLNLKSDAVQPNWSPHGDRIAYWGSQSGRRRICTVPAQGGAPVCITDDVYLNWNPVWSPDGRNLYFSSNRGGSMNLWRIPIDEKSGKSLGAPVAVTTPSPYSGYFSFSRDGNRLAYSQLIKTLNLYRVGFDPQRRTIAGRPIPITQGARVTCCPDLSPDGQWIAFGTAAAQRETISLIRPDGSDERQVTDDAFLNRQPRWSPDGKLLAFHTNRSGHFEVWTIHPDGSELRQMSTTSRTGRVVYSCWSPDGKRLAYSALEGGPHIVQVDQPLDPKTEEVLPPPAGANSAFVAWDWSQDGERLVGDGFLPDGSRAGILTYSFKTKSYETFAAEGSTGIWLNDGRNVVFQRQGKLMLGDRQTHVIRELLSLSFDQVDSFPGISRDQRTIYYGQDHVEADIWLLTQTPGKALASH